jgi:Na+/pantothenate symporter
MLVSYFLHNGLTEEVARFYEESFWMLCYLVEEVIPKEYYTTMISLTADINLLLLLMSLHKKKLYKHIMKINFELPMVLVEMFITVFTAHCTLLTDIMMDLVLLEGSIVYFKVVLVFFGYIEQEVLKVTEFCSLASPRRRLAAHQRQIQD